MLHGLIQSQYAINAHANEKLINACFVVFNIKCHPNCVTMLPFQVHSPRVLPPVTGAFPNPSDHLNACVSCALTLCRSVVTAFPDLSKDLNKCRIFTADGNDGYNYENKAQVEKDQNYPLSCLNSYIVKPS